jgi:metal iron transporter
MAGREGLSNVLNVSQVVLSVLLPAVTAPLIIFTCSKEIMRVPIFLRDGEEDSDITVETDEIFNLTSRASTLVESPHSTTQKNKRFKSTEPAIKLQDLRNSHPCAGWDDDDEMLSEEHQRLVQAADRAAAGPDVPTNQLEYTATNPRQRSTSMDLHRVVGYKDMSNGPLMSFTAILIWGFVTCLNLYLIGNLLLGYDTPL